MNLKEKLIEVLARAASIALGLILFVAFMIGVPLALFLMTAVAVFCRYVMIWHHDFLRMGFLGASILGFLVFFVFGLHSVIKASKGEKESKGGDS
ncbi:hypothetical protein [Stenotrophomonas maltophilia]|uniref:hypothetical protein n=1 Tax=Stenotrophomonas maltophilia TaxID=40324 RepID=UPI000DAA99C5|nr:hypothetical protein [Stenotrophomonas maltophilia]PZT17472.1 hypothetical protein A7Y00_19620 [Stenotrophomonas maltophilia]QGL66971.1 hypothetical protein FEO86_06605 [Stenotrophomonas maltophilia]HDS1361868.1 hypothetical protein [Stenotrophomonas maltophilia]